MGVSAETVGRPLPWAGRSELGGRARNEDRLAHHASAAACLLLMADGMGGHPEGEFAAAHSVALVGDLFEAQAQPRLEQPGDFLARALHHAHASLRAHAHARGLPDAPRTTLVACLVQDGQAWAAHCGDSRLYLGRGGRLSRRTRDHSYAERPELAELAPPGLDLSKRHVLCSCLGGPQRPLVELGGPWRLEPGDRLLLASDGLWGPLSPARLQSLILAGRVDEAVPAAVEAAWQAAGPRSDNISALALDWPGTGPFVG